MSSKASENLQKYLLIGGGLAASYFLVHYLASRKGSSSKSIPLETTLTILKEIKYQVYASCIAFAEGVNAKLKANYPAKDLEVFLRTELTKTYELKEDLILTKHMVSRDEYEIALKKYKKNAQVAADQAEIIRVLEDSVRGQVDLSVPAPAAQLFNRQQLLAIYREVCEEIGVKVWQKLLESKRNNPGFDSKNDQHFKAAIRELGIYEFKVNFLREKGLREQWGCPNLIFLKLLEEAKRQNAEVKAEATFIEKGYELIISKVSNDLDAYDRVKILRLMEDTIAEHRNKGKQPAPVPAPPARPQQAAVHPPPPPPQQKKPVAAKPAKEEEEFDLEKMMMDELLSRSQEEPKQEKKEVPVKAEPVPEVKVEVEGPRVVEIVESVAVEPVEPVEVKAEHEVPASHVPEIESRIEEQPKPLEIVHEHEAAPEHHHHHVEPAHEEKHQHVEHQAEVHHEQQHQHHEEVHEQPPVHESHDLKPEVVHHEPEVVHHEPEVHQEQHKQVVDMATHEIHEEKTEPVEQAPHEEEASHRE